MNDRVFIAGIYERDIDLLLLEEFISSDQFQHWFVRQVFNNGQRVAHCLGARRSVTQSLGESDLEVGFVTDNGLRLCCLIENKINASFQKNQAKRYHERGATYVSRGEFDVFRTILVAPARYFGSTEASKGFDAKLTYEALIDYFSSELPHNSRHAYKTSLLRSAVDKATYGYQPEEDAPVTNFWHAYWQTALKYSPNLEMKEPVAKPSGAGFIHFRPAVLPKEVHVIHKLSRGCVDLQFDGMGKKLRILQEMFENCIDQDMIFVETTKSGAIRIRVAALNTGVDFSMQIDAVLEGLSAANRLLVWFLQHQTIWNQRQPLQTTK